MNSYQPYDDDELKRLQMLYPRPDDLGAPIPMQTQPMAPEPPSPTPAPIAAPERPPAAPAPAALDLSVPTAPADKKAKGMAVTKVESQGYSEPWLNELAGLHKQLTGDQLAQIDENRKTEQAINERGLGQANARGIEAANQAVYKQREIDESQRKQAELRKAQEEWASKKEDPSAIWSGREWAHVLTSIGIAAGTFSQAMGWQNGNPVREAMDRSIDRELAAQREQKASRLNQLAARLGDEKAAELQVRGELHDAIATRTAAQLQGTQYQDAIQRLTPIAQEQALKAKQAQADAFEKLAPKQTVTETPVKAAGGGDAAKKLKEALEIDALLEKQGRTPEQRQSVLKAAGLPLPDKGTLTAAEQTNKEQADAAEERKRLAADKLAKLTPEERKDFRTKVDGLADVAETLDNMSKAGSIPRDAKGEFTTEGAKLGHVAGFGQTMQDAAHSLPWHIGEAAEGAMSSGASKEANDMRRNRDTIAAGLAKAEFARNTEFEFGNEQKRIPLNNPTDLVSGLNYADQKAKTHYRNAVGQYGQDVVDRELRQRGVDPARFQ